MANTGTHTVAAGETMVLIARRHGVTLKALLAANPQIQNANRIRVGRTITLPAGQLAPSPEPVLAGAGIGAGIDVPGVVNIPVLPVAPPDSIAFAEMDKRGKAKQLHPIFRERLIMLAETLAARGMKALITDGLRTFAEQDKLFEIGRRGVPGEKKVTHARGGMSNHNYGLAVDLYPVLPDSKGKERVFTDVPPTASVEFGRAFAAIQNAIGDISEALGLFWGARFAGLVDTPHVQLLAQHDMSPKECLAIFRDNGNSLQPVWDEAARRVRPISL